MLHALHVAAAAWLAAHPYQVVGYGCVALMAAVSQLPARYARLPAVGYAIRVIDYLSVFAHKDEPNRTLSLPGIPSLVLRAIVAVATGTDRAPVIPLAARKPPPDGGAS